MAAHQTDSEPASAARCSGVNGRFGKYLGFFHSAPLPKLTDLLPSAGLTAKITIPLLFAFAVFLAAAHVGYSYLEDHRDQIHRNLKAHLIGIEHISDFQHDLMAIKAELYRLSASVPLDADDSAPHRENARIGALIKSAQLSLQRLESHDRNGAIDVRTYFASYKRGIEEALAALAAEADSGRSAFLALDDQFADLIMATETFVARAKSRMRDRALIANEASTMEVERLIFLPLMLVLTAIILVVVIYIHVSRPVGRLARCVSALENGASAIEMPYRDRRDEIGYIARTLQSFSQTLIASRKKEKDVSGQKDKALKFASAARDAIAAKSTFYAKVSHELRTPLHAILGMAELMRETHLDQRQRYFADTIMSSSTALLKVINDILDLSKLEAGHLRLDPQPFDLAGTLNSVTSLLSPAAEQKSLSLTVEIGEPDPPIFSGDADRIRQVLINLVENAIKFTEDGYVKILAEWQDDNGAALLRILVEDTGIGISDGVAAEIFDEFVQADDQPDRGNTGTGLGLSIARNLVDAMGGQIGARANADRGSTFWFEVTLPIAAGKRAADMKKPESAVPVMQADCVADHNPALPSVTNPDSHARIWGRILVADDNRLNRVLVENMIGTTNCTLAFAENGEIAAQMAREQQFDLILMDISMPVLDGLEATRRIREQETEDGRTATPVLALTAHSIGDDAQQFLDAGMDGYLPKPLRKAQLVETIETILNEAQSPSGAFARLA